MSRGPAAKQIAESFEAIAAEAVHARGPVPIKAGKGRTRTLKIVDKSGAVVGVTTHGKVLEGAARVAEIEIAVQGGTRPEFILCVCCKRPRATDPNGPLPKKCTECTKKRTRDPEKKKAQSKAWIAANHDKAKAIFKAAGRRYLAKRKASGVVVAPTEERKKIARAARSKWTKAHPEKNREKARQYRARKKARDHGSEFP